MLQKEVILTTLGYPPHYDYFACTPCIHQSYARGDSFLFSSSCFLTFLINKIKPSEHCSLLLMPFSLRTVDCSWFDEYLLHLFPLSFQACTQKPLYFVRGGSSICQLTPWLISMFSGTTSTPGNILLQLTLTCILMNTSHSQEKVRPAMILATIKTIYRAARNELTFGFFKHHAT